MSVLADAIDLRSMPSGNLVRRHHSAVNTLLVAQPYPLPSAGTRNLPSSTRIPEMERVLLTLTPKGSSTTFRKSTPYDVWRRNRIFSVLRNSTVVPGYGEVREVEKSQDFARH